MRLRDGFRNFAARLGYGADNLMSHAEYDATYLSRNRLLLENVYRSSWILGKAVDAIAEDMTTAGITISHIDQEVASKISAQMTSTGLWDQLCLAIKWSRLYGGAVLFVHVSGQDQSTPLDIDTVSNDVSFVALDRWRLQPDLTRLVKSGRSIGTPEYYSIITAIDNDVALIPDIHHTRMIRFIGNKLPYYQEVGEQYWGASVLERIYDRLISFDTVTMSAANLISRAYLRTIKVDQLREILGMGGSAQAALEQMVSFIRQQQSSEGITMIDAKDDLQTASYTFAGLDDLLLSFGQQLAGALDTPMVRLFGQSPKGLNATGESDLKIYYSNIRRRQETELRLPISRLIRMLHIVITGQRPESDIDFEFNTLETLSSEQQASVATATTSAIIQAHDSGLISTQTALKELQQASATTGIFTHISEEEIDSAGDPDVPDPLEGLL